MRSLLVVTIAVLVEALALGVAVVVYGVALLRSHASDLLGAIVTGLLCLVASVALVLAARAVLAGRRGARGPVLTWQLLQALVAFDFLGGPLRWWAGAGIVVSVVTVVALFSPSAMAATRAREMPDRRGG